MYQVIKSVNSGFLKCENNASANRITSECVYIGSELTFLSRVLKEYSTELALHSYKTVGHMKMGN